MAIHVNRNFIRSAFVLISLIIVSLISWNTYVFFQKFKAEERVKMENWSFAQIDIAKNLESDSNQDIGELPLQIISSNQTTPMITVSKRGEYNFNNIDEEKARDTTYVKALIEKFKKENKPIEIRYDGEVLSTIYYGNSPLLNKLKYYPMALVLIIVLFAAVAYFFYRSTKTADQNKLWTGMAKETAHQIGTPLSSLVGWSEILKAEQVNPEYLVEIEKDINRLQTITERFSKIGSIPNLDEQDIVAATKESYQYLKSRSSKLIKFEISVPNETIFVKLNEPLYSWTIENLVKNAIDAMKGKGTLTIHIENDQKFVHILISDTGKGISKNLFKTIFEPGYTSKKRGWGLGLSLSKRIIEDYHQGKIKVKHSEIGKGTTMQISLRVV
ncbi:HAMP domain-containing histidine kinase [Paucihalobacter ruber]|uniref:histidine kinase n=1 Tax=Paucihalobacter ruber TaxID=2567861 RepID=A0A506PR07_9FLAO|nr:HAMP domain-containing sensor histidine kinase [Paucihalobacter ruber]TPV34650.1 HAMP domain-containing histidine kinase [Paucihalobacter ruber]